MVQDKHDAKDLVSKNPRIEFRDVHFSYPKSSEFRFCLFEGAAKPETIQSGEILKGISFTV
jgi:ATP-binding cassette subfamily B protein